jgi:hypothetical protein
MAILNIIGLILNNLFLFLLLIQMAMCLSYFALSIKITGYPKSLKSTSDASNKPDFMSMQGTAHAAAKASIHTKTDTIKEQQSRRAA